MPDWISAVAAVLAALFAGLSWLSSRQSKDAKNEARTQAEAATKAAARAATAQEQTADASSRVAEVMERGLSGAEDKPWRIEGSGDGDYHLINTTTAKKYHVKISGEVVRNSVGFDSIDREEVDGHERIWLDVMTYAQLEDRSVLVEWFPTPYRHTGRRTFGAERPTAPKRQRLQLP